MTWHLLYFSEIYCWLMQVQAPDFYKFPHTWITSCLLLFIAITDPNQQFFHFPAFLCNYSSFIYCFAVARRLQRHRHGMKLKIQSMSHIWFAHPPTLKKTVKTKKKKKTWHHLQLVFFISMLNVHVSPMSSCSGWLPSMSVHQKIKGSGGVKQITNSKSYTQFTVYQQYACWQLSRPHKWLLFSYIYKASNSPFYCIKWHWGLEALPAGGTF